MAGSDYQGMKIPNTVRGRREPVLSMRSVWGGFESFSNVKELAKLSELLRTVHRDLLHISILAQGLQVSCNYQFWHAFLNYMGYFVGYPINLILQTASFT